MDLPSSLTQVDIILIPSTGTLPPPGLQDLLDDLNEPSLENVRAMFTAAASTLDRDLALHYEERQWLKVQYENLANLRKQCESEPHMQTTVAYQIVLDQCSCQRKKTFKKDVIFSENMPSLQTSFANKAVEM